MKNTANRIRLQEVPPSEPDEEDLKGPTLYYAVIRISDGKEIGKAEIRLALNEYMRKFGGNLGYLIVPEERGKGYGHEILRELLILCRQKNIRNILITCYENNLPSKKMIERAGGVIDGIASDEQGKILRYRISIS